MSRKSIMAGLLSIAILGFLLMTLPAQAYQNTHTLTGNDSVSTALPSYLAGTTLYLHGKALEIGYVRTRVHLGGSNVAYCTHYNGDCCEDQGAFPDNGHTYLHTTVVYLHQSGTGIGMLTDQIKAKLRACEEQQHD